MKIRVFMIVEWDSLFSRTVLLYFRFTNCWFLIESSCELVP